MCEFTETQLNKTRPSQTCFLVCESLWTGFSTGGNVMLMPESYLISCLQLLEPFKETL